MRELFRRQVALTQLLYCPSLAGDKMDKLDRYTNGQFDNVILNICSIKLYAFCHCERSEAVSWFARGLLRRKERSSQ